ncbi:MAG: hypothetical protein J6L73_08755 [Muribaculaceae bacterium]|nr:hypothetical protein [Muribaculaceae bacterium]
MYKKLIYCIPVMLAALGVSSVNVAAAPATVKARLDSAYIVMGQKTDLHLEVVKDRKIPGHFPMFSDESELPYVTLNGDTIELSKDFRSDTVDLGSGRTQINYHIPLQAFDSGFYSLPPLKYVAGSDTVESNRVAIKVIPVNATAKTEIAGMTDVAEPEGKSFWDKIPDVIYDYWWLILLILALVGGLVYFYFKYGKKGGFKLRTQTALPPYEEAVNALKRLKSKQLWQQGADDQYFTELTDILRRYISRRFGVAAPEMTSTQFLEEASSNEKLAPYRQDLKELLEIADFVKFANAKSLPDENERAYSVASRFVETTRPTREEEDALKQAEAQPQEKATVTGKKIKRQTAASQKQRKQSGKRTAAQSSNRNNRAKGGKGKEVKK